MKKEFKFVWDLSEERWEEYKVNLEADDFIGNCRVGEICFDIVVRAYADDCFILDYDCYVGGIDDLYGYTYDGYPYSHCDGGSFETDCTEMSLEEFKKMAEKEFTKFILDSSDVLLEKANAPLHLW